MKKRWGPPWAYESRPWAALILGGIGGLAGLLAALIQGHWSGLTTTLIGMGSVLAIYGGILLQLRREYRSTSKWVREHPPKE
jgi:hypothetical protein